MRFRRVVKDRNSLFPELLEVNETWLETHSKEAPSSLILRSIAVPGCRSPSEIANSLITFERRCCQAQVVVSGRHCRRFLAFGWVPVLQILCAAMWRFGKRQETHQPSLQGFHSAYQNPFKCVNLRFVLFVDEEASKRTDESCTNYVSQVIWYNEPQEIRSNSGLKENVPILSFCQWSHNTGPSVPQQDDTPKRLFYHAFVHIKTRERRCFDIRIEP